MTHQWAEGDKIDILLLGQQETGRRLLCFAMGGIQEALIRLAGPRSLLLLGDTMVVDRWRWVEPRLPARPASLVDVGCGNGWLAINCSRRGYRTLGLGWDGPDLAKAKKRAANLGSDACFEVQDVRTLSARHDLKESFDIATCLETIEHVLDDTALMVSLATILRPGGRLILTTPNEEYQTYRRWRCWSVFRRRGWWACAERIYRGAAKLPRRTGRAGDYGNRVLLFLV